MTDSTPPPVSARDQQVFGYAALVITGLGLLLRLAFIDQPISFDEAITYQKFVRPPLTESLTTYGDPNNHFLNTLLSHSAIAVSGRIDLWVWRLPAFIAGVLLIPTTFWATRRFYGAQVALVAAGLVAIAPQLVLYSTNARGYSIEVLCFVILLGLAHDLREQSDLRRESTRRQWALFVAVTAAGFYAIPAMLYPFGVVAVWLLASIIEEHSGRTRLRLLRDLLVSCVVAGSLVVLFYLPALVNGNWRGLTRTQGLADFLRTVPDLVDRLWQIWTHGVQPLLVIAAVAGFLVGLVIGKRGADHRVPLVATAVVVLTLALLIQRPLFIATKSRLLLFLLPLCLMTVSVGLAALFGWIVRIPSRQALILPLLVLALVIGGSWQIIAEQPFHSANEGGSFRDGEQAALFLGEVLHPADAILCSGPCDYILRYYFERDGIDPAPLDADPNQADRIVIVMNQTEFLDFRLDMPVDELLLRRLTSETRTQMGEVALMQRFRSAAVYEIRRAVITPADG